MPEIIEEVPCVGACPGGLVQQCTRRGVLEGCLSTHPRAAIATDQLTDESGLPVRAVPEDGACYPLSIEDEIPS